MTGKKGNYEQKVFHRTQDPCGEQSRMGANQSCCSDFIIHPKLVGVVDRFTLRSPFSRKVVDG